VPFSSPFITILAKRRVSTVFPSPFGAFAANQVSFTEANTMPGPLRVMT